MIFADQIQADLDVFINSDEFGVQTVYTPVLGLPVSCNVILDHDVVLQPSHYDAVVVETGSTIEALVKDVGTPLKGSTFVIDLDIYIVQRITDNDENFVTMVVKKQ